jgi:antirestriction protein ArdC
MVFTFQPPFFAGLSGYVAEIGSGLVCAHLGLPNELHDNHASYVAHWLGILRADKTAIIHAASKAEQAFNYLTGFTGTNADGEDPGVAAEAEDRLPEAA